MRHNYWKYWVWAPKHGDGTAGSVDLIDIPVLCMLCGDQILSNHLRSLTIWAAHRNQVIIVSVTSEITCFASEPNKASIYIPDSPLYLRAQHKLLLPDYDHNQRIVGSSSPVRKVRPVKLCFVNLISSGCPPLLAKSQRSTSLGFPLNPFESSSSWTLRPVVLIPHVSRRQPSFGCMRTDWDTSPRL